MVYSAKAKLYFKLAIVFSSWVRSAALVSFPLSLAWCDAEIALLRELLWLSWVWLIRYTVSPDCRERSHLLRRAFPPTDYIHMLGTILLTSQSEIG